MVGSHLTSTSKSAKYSHPFRSVATRLNKPALSGTNNCVLLTSMPSRYHRDATKSLPAVRETVAFLVGQIVYNLFNWGGKLMDRATCTLPFALTHPSPSVNVT